MALKGRGISAHLFLALSDVRHKKVFNIDDNAEDHDLVQNHDSTGQKCSQIGLDRAAEKVDVAESGVVTEDVVRVDVGLQAADPLSGRAGADHDGLVVLGHALAAVPRGRRFALQLEAGRRGVVTEDSLNNIEEAS